MIQKILHALKLDQDLDDYDVIHATIEKDIIFKGTNLWILAFAIVIASIGLNMNSTAVIIGAMLISPLMGPINGMGYSIATYNMPLFRKALKNLSFAVVASLIASTLYFAISPVSTAHSELLARTSPTIYDVLIALFGGMAGIVAISSKSKGNVIPGVAIATALMPPLCTAGYGLATGQFNFFFGAFYLFTINTVFIALASIAASQVLSFPNRTLMDAAQKRRINNMITVVILVTVIPSVYFGYGLVQKEAFMDRSAKFTHNVSIVEGTYLLKEEVNPEDKTITLIYGGNTLTEGQKKAIGEKAKDFSLADVRLVFKQGFSIDDVKGRETQRESQMDALKAEVNRLQMALREKDRQEEVRKKETMLGGRLLSEIQALYPQIVACTYGRAAAFRKGIEGPNESDVVVFKMKPRSLNMADRRKIKNWLAKRTGRGNIQVFYEN
ncbi:MAG: DUF389 domain-containing protein [Deltaproteobacteria bacterium]